MKKHLRIIACLLLLSFIPCFTACTKPQKNLSSSLCSSNFENLLDSSESSSESDDKFVPELRICGAGILPQRSDDFLYDYEKHNLFTYTFIDEDEDYLYLIIDTGKEYYLPKSGWSLIDRDLVRINKKTSERDVVDTRLSSYFTTIKNNKIYYYKITDNNLNAVLTEYDTKTGMNRALNIKDIPSDLFIGLWEVDDHIEWETQMISDAGDGKYIYTDYENEFNCVVNTYNGKQYKLPIDNYNDEFVCEYDGKYYYGVYNGEYDNSFVTWTSGPETFTLYSREIESNDIEVVCSLDFSNKEKYVSMGYKYVGNGCIFIWNQEMFGKYWIYDIKTDELILKENDKQYGGIMAEGMQSYWTFDYDDDAFYFAERMDEDYNYSIQRVTYNGLNQETLINIPIDRNSNIKICNGYIYVYGFQHYPHDLEIIMRYNMDGSNPVEILYNKYEITEVLSSNES